MRWPTLPRRRAHSRSGRPSRTAAWCPGRPSLWQHSARVSCGLPGSSAGRSGRLSAHDGGVALVTGGSRGIGAAIAQALRDDGWRVATLSRNARGVGQDPTLPGADYSADVSDVAAVDSAFDAVEADLGPVLALVNNAGRTDDGLAIRM